MKVTEIYRCPVCGLEYDSREKAEACMKQQKEETDLQVGDIVEAKYGFGWWDGDEKWIINPEANLKIHGFGPKHSLGFYYVITKIENENHRLKFHLFTKAMKPSTGYSQGYTYLNGHYLPKKIKAPKSVIEDSKDLIGNTANRLI